MLRSIYKYLYIFWCIFAAGIEFLAFVFNLNKWWDFVFLLLTIMFLYFLWDSLNKKT